jgi:hypothetical protein
MRKGFAFVAILAAKVAFGTIVVRLRWIRRLISIALFI